jgi:hypothetical protein
MFWGEQQAIAAIVAVACNFFVPRVMDLVALRNGKQARFCLPTVDCARPASIFFAWSFSA